MESNNFKARIIQARKRAGLTQLEAARALGVTQQGYQYYESSSRDIKASVLKKMAMTFKCSTNYLLGISDGPYEAKGLKAVGQTSTCFGDEDEKPHGDESSEEGTNYPAPHLTEDELFLLDAYRQIDDKAKDIVHTIVEDMRLSKRHIPQAE